MSVEIVYRYVLAVLSFVLYIFAGGFVNRPNEQMRAVIALLAAIYLLQLSGHRITGGKGE